MSRRKYTREFKVSAVKLVNEQGYLVAEVAKRLGVDPVYDAAGNMTTLPKAGDETVGSTVCQVSC